MHFLKKGPRNSSLVDSIDQIAEEFFFTIFNVLAWGELSPPPATLITKLYQRRRVGEREEVRGCKGEYEEVLEEGRGPRVPRSKCSKVPRVPRYRGPKVPGSKGPRYLKLTFKYELDSKEGPSCFYDN